MTLNRSTCVSGSVAERKVQTAVWNSGSPPRVVGSRVKREYFCPAAANGSVTLPPHGLPANGFAFCPAAAQLCATQETNRQASKRPNRCLKRNMHLLRKGNSGVHPLSV